MGVNIAAGKEIRFEALLTQYPHRQNEFPSEAVILNREIVPAKHFMNEVVDVLEADYVDKGAQILSYHEILIGRLRDAADAINSDALVNAEQRRLILSTIDNAVDCAKEETPEECRVPFLFENESRGSDLLPFIAFVNSCRG